MKISVSRALNECLLQLREGKTVDECLAEYPHLRGQLKPLLDTAALITAIPKESPSAKFRKTSHRRLMARLSPYAKPCKTFALSVPIRAIYGRLLIACQEALHILVRSRKLAISVAIALLLTIGSTVFLFGAPGILSTRPALAASCTLTVLNGSVTAQSPDSEVWADAQDGITLKVGSRVKTNTDSNAVLTFFDGSTVKLDPNTEMTIEQLEGNGSRPTSIVLRQWLGRTWSSVSKMIIPDSRFEIKTRTASALVRGTLFATEVDQTGLMAVKTTEGLVSVAAQSQEVQVAAGQETAVESGLPPATPASTPPPENQVVITIQMPAVGSVRDPSGASTGYFPSGLAFNQIPGSRSSSPSEGIQTITIPQPKAGEYVITLRGIDSGAAEFSIRGESKGQAIFEQAGLYQVSKGDGGLININLGVTDGHITGATTGSPEPIGGRSPEHVVVAPAAAEKAAAITMEDNSGEQKEAKGQQQTATQGKATEQGKADSEASQDKSDSSESSQDNANKDGGQGNSDQGNSNNEGRGQGGSSGGGQGGGNSGGGSSGGGQGGGNSGGGSSGGGQGGGNSGGGSSGGGQGGGNSGGGSSGGGQGGGNSGGGSSGGGQGGGNSGGGSSGGGQGGGNSGGGSSGGGSSGGGQGGGNSGGGSSGGGQGGGNSGGGSSGSGQGGGRGK